MKLRMWRAALIAAMSLASGGQEVIAQPASHNAATWYQRAIDQFQRSFSEQDREAIYNYLENPQQPPSTQVRDLVNRAQPILSAVRQGSTQQYSDFNLDRDAGFEMLLPHLSPLRGIGRIMAADVQVRLHDGDASAAASRIGDMYRMSGQFGDDRVLISSLVGQAVFGLAESTLQASVDRGAIGPDESAAVLSAVNALSTNDPFQYVEAVVAEQDLAVAYLTEKFIDDVDGDFPEALLGLGAGEENVAELMTLGKDGLQAEIDKYDSFMTEVVEAFSIADPAQATARMAELQKQIESGEIGVLSQLLMPGFGKCLENKLKGEKMLADRIAMLKAMATGEVTIEDTANAAVWYLRGLEMLERAEHAAMLQQVRQFAADPDSPMSEELATFLRGPAVEAIDQFRQGSMIKRCDFSGARPSGLAFAPPYAAGMHDAMRTLLCEADRLADGGQTHEAAQLLATAFRISGHLGADPVLISSLIAHANFDRIIAYIRPRFEKMFDERDRAVLRDGLERISRRDPFGYVGAVLQARKDISGRFTRSVSHDPDQQARWHAAAERINDWNADLILHYMVVLDTLQRNAAREHAQASVERAAAHPGTKDERSTSDALQHLSDVLDSSAMELVRADTARVAPMLAADDLDIFAGVDSVPALVTPHGALARMRAARGDLRHAMMLLRAKMDETDSADGADTAR